MPLIKTRPQAYLWEVTPVNLTEKDIKWLDKATEKDYNGLTTREVVTFARAGVLTIWRVGDFEGVVVTEIVNTTAFKYLLVTHIACKGYLKIRSKIDGFLTEYAIKHGVSRIRATADRPGLQRVYSRLYKELTRVYEKEI